jgi:hypothetical protein
MASIAFGLAYCFFGGRVFPVIHSLICGLFGVVIVSFIMGALTNNALVAFLIGATVATFCGIQCYKLKSV